jgi:hypothetical protein
MEKLIELQRIIEQRIGSLREEVEYLMYEHHSPNLGRVYRNPFIKKEKNKMYSSN